MQQFLKDLNDFYREVIDDWHQQSGLLIGISIQKFDDLQDEDAITRDTHATKDIVANNKGYINHYCYHILSEEGNIEKCNKLDFFMKKYASEEKSANKIMCKCHGGVSNILIKYKYPATIVEWYIFLGQFLLEEPIDKLKEHFYLESGIKPVNIQTLNRKYQSSKGLINDGAFVDESYKNTKVAESVNKEGRDEISLVPADRYFYLESIVLRRFEIFISKYFNTNGQSQLFPNETLKAYLEHIDIDNVKFNLEISLQKAQELSDNRKPTCDIINIILTMLDSTSNDAIPNELLKRISEFSIAYKKGALGLDKFLKAGKEIFNSLNEIVTKKKQT